MTQTAEILEALPPVQMQPTGLAQFDLAVTATPLVINWNRDAVSALLTDQERKYYARTILNTRNWWCKKRTCPPSSPKWRG